MVRRDSDPAPADGPFVLTLADPTLAMARLLEDSPVAQAQLSAGIVELLLRSFGDGVGVAAQRQRGLAPLPQIADEGFPLHGSGGWLSWSESLDDDLDADQGTLAYRGQSLWRPRGPGAANYLLKTLGASEDPLWARSPGAIPFRATLYVGGAADVAGVITVDPAAKYADITLIGSGGGAGQANASSASNISLGNAGGGGAALRHIITDPINGYAYLLGAYGGNASQGTTSTITLPGPVLLTAPGGGAGSTIGSSNTLVVAGHTNGAAVASNGNVWNRGGKASGKTIRFSGTVAVGGHGGASPGFGTGGKGRVSTGLGDAGHGYGAGGSGGLSSNGAAAQTGGVGAPAAILVVEYEAAS